MGKPDKTVAESIKNAFEGKGLIKDMDLATLAERLAVGTISEQDWKLMAELSLETQKGDSDAEEN